jgi:predicted nuclease of predicted toxin-antitoxin system
VLNETVTKKYRLPKQAQTWCEPSTLPPLDYRQCDTNGVVYQIPFMAGLTNGLKMLLLTVIGAYEENKCFFVSENPQNRLLLRDDKSQQLKTFLGRYFEPIGLAKDDVIVATARRTNQIMRTNWADYWESAKRRRLHGRHHNISSLGYVNVESTELKRTMLQRMWRLLPDVRDQTCTALEAHGIEDEYLAFSVRRGDKDTEGFEFTKSEDYIAAADVTRVKYFDGKMPVIFVATDDCAVMGEFRQLRPDWTFVSECDHNNGHNGFVLADMKNWTLEQTVRHLIQCFR